MAKIVLSGFMGSGKSTVGSRLSQVLGLKFFDLDKEIEKEAGKSIREIFEVDGEKVFREIERKLLLKFLKKDMDFVLSIGGGAITYKDSLDEIIKNSIPILLDGRAEVFYERIKGDGDRPLLKSKEEFISLFEKRRKFYKKIPLKVDGEKGIDDVVREIISLFKENVIYKPHKIKVKLGLSFSIKNLSGFFIIDENVANLFSNRFPKDFKGYILPSGERAKSMDEVLKIYDRLAHFKVGRNGRVICIGGGVSSDVSGFVSSTYMRGIKFSIFPTTLLSQVDSSIGGKNGVNLPHGKNLVGTVYLPEFVYIDPSFLWILPKEEILSGLGEIFKYGILSKNGIFEILEREELSFMTIQKLIYPSIVEKIKWIKDDIFDRKGKRIFLNFGHTFGHLFEKVLGYGNITHGEAVAFGIVLSSYISNRLGILKGSDFDRILKVYKRIGFSLDKFSGLKEIEEKEMEDTLLVDKKTEGKNITLILPKEIGEVILKRDFSTKFLINYLYQFLNNFRRFL